MTKSRGILAPRREWTPSEDAVLRARYATEHAARIATDLGRSLSTTYQRAQKLGLKKPLAWIAENARANMEKPTHGGRRSRFQKGHVSANKGLRRPGYSVGRGRMQETQFKKGSRSGVAVRLYKPIGTERLSKEGYRERKIHDGLPLQSRWRAVHLLVWEEANGPIPKGHAIWFRNRIRADVRLENLELITRAELARRNVKTYPIELRQITQLRGAITRQINKRARHEEQDRRSA